MKGNLVHASADFVEQMAFDHPTTTVQIDTATSRAYVTVGRTTYWAELTGATA